ncbi:hypothetical protein BC829DRAFT_494396 [Chytridium lagenaria]|nr:hypothetical protein BC829DRAFT_494396 [Chytridium lagenaria]
MSISSKTLRHLIPLQNLLQSDAESTICSVLSCIAKASGPEGRQFGLVGLFLVHLDQILRSKQITKPTELPLPALYVIVKDALNDAGQRITTSHVSSSQDVLGIMCLQKPRMSFWFRDGPGCDSGDAQRRLVKDTIEESFREIDVTMTKTTTDLPEDYEPRFVFLHTVDVRYIPIVREISTPEWEESDHGMFELPARIKFSGVKKLGDTWTDADTGDVYVMDVVNVEDYDQVREYSTADYPEAYVKLLLSQQPMASLSRAIRLKSSNTSKKGSMVAWSLTHTNFAVGLTSTISTHRRRGLANICVASLATAQREWIKQITGATQSEVMEVFVPFCYIADTNVASQSLFRRIGFTRESCAARNWIGVWALGE